MKEYKNVFFFFFIGLILNSCWLMRPLEGSTECFVQSTQKYRFKLTTSNGVSLAIYEIKHRETHWRQSSVEECFNFTVFKWCTNHLQTHSVTVRWSVVNSAVSVFIPETWIRIIPQQILQTPDRQTETDKLKHSTDGSKTPFIISIEKLFFSDNRCIFKDSTLVHICERK